MNKQNQDDKPDQEDETPDTNVIDWEERLCRQVLDEWDRGRSYVSDLDELYEDLYRMLRGERPEKNYDWQSNIVINKVFQVVWTAIPYLVQKIFGATPIIGVDSFDKTGAWQRERILEFWHTMQPANNSPQIPWFSVMVMWTLRAMLNGIGIVKKTWHQKLVSETVEKQIVVPMKLDEMGNETEVEPHTIKNTKSYPAEDFPVNTVVNNKDIVFDWLLQPGQSMRQGRFVIHRSVIDLDSLYSSKINYINLDQIKPKGSNATTDSAQDHADLKSMDGQEAAPDSDIYADVEVYERVGKIPVYKKKKDGQWMPCFDKDECYDNKKVTFKDMIIAVAKTDGEETNNILIRLEPNEYEEINYIDMHIYFDAERWNSIGLIEPIKDLQTGINNNINAMFDEIWQNLMPPVVVNKFALWDWDTMQYAPQQRWLVGGNPAESIYFKEGSNITRDAWQKHALLDNEVQLTTVTNAMSGAGREKTATTNVMNAQLTAGKLDFLVKMIETTALIPSAQMDVRFASKFAHPLTFEMIVGTSFEYTQFEEIYKYVPAASSVKLEHQKEKETQEDIQLMQIVASMPNPNTSKIMNVLWGNILRNRNMPKEAALFDEEYFEPQGDAGNMQMLKRMMGGNVPSNQNAIPMSQQEKGVRQSMYQRPKLIRGGSSAG